LIRRTRVRRSYSIFCLPRCEYRLGENRLALKRSILNQRSGCAARYSRIRGEHKGRLCMHSLHKRKHTDYNPRHDRYRKSLMTPFIQYKKINATTSNVYELSVLKTEGSNIDWDKTMWYIYDGNESVIQKQGSKIMHAFALKSEQFGYPVMVEMFKKGNTSPYVVMRVSMSREMSLCRLSITIRKS